MKTTLALLLVLLSHSAQAKERVQASLDFAIVIPARVQYSTARDGSAHVQANLPGMQVQVDCAGNREPQAPHFALQTSPSARPLPKGARVCPDGARHTVSFP